jgi:hypothetical protein
MVLLNKPCTVSRLKTNNVEKMRYTSSSTLIVMPTFFGAFLSFGGLGIVIISSLMNFIILKIYLDILVACVIMIYKYFKYVNLDDCIGWLKSKDIFAEDSRRERAGSSESTT